MVFWAVAVVKGAVHIAYFGADWRITGLAVFIVVAVATLVWGGNGIAIGAALVGGAHIGVGVVEVPTHGFRTTG